MSLRAVYALKLNLAVKQMVKIVNKTLIAVQNGANMVVHIYHQNVQLFQIVEVIVQALTVVDVYVRQQNRSSMLMLTVLLRHQAGLKLAVNV